MSKSHICVSFSGMQLYEGCPSAFQRRYILKEDTSHVPDGTSPAAVRGTRVHKGVENYLLRKEPELPEEALAFEGLFEGIRDGRDALPEEKFCFDEDWERVPFEDKERGRVRGILDIAYYDDETNTAYVQELKTGKKYPEHSKQRSLYGLAGLLMFPEADNVVVNTVYLDGALVDALTISRAQMESYQYVWQRYINKPQPPQPYTAKKNWKCRFCPYNAEVGGKCQTGKK